MADEKFIQAGTQSGRFSSAEPNYSSAAMAAAYADGRARERKEAEWVIDAVMTALGAPPIDNDYFYDSQWEGSWAAGVKYLGRSPKRPENPPQPPPSHAEWPSPPDDYP